VAIFFAPFEPVKLFASMSPSFFLGGALSFDCGTKTPEPSIAKSPAFCLKILLTTLIAFGEFEILLTSFAL